MVAGACAWPLSFVDGYAKGVTFPVPYPGLEAWAKAGAVPAVANAATVSATERYFFMLQVFLGLISTSC
jgi:hypothetical protein